MFDHALPYDQFDFGLDFFFLFFMKRITCWYCDDVFICIYDNIILCINVKTKREQLQKKTITDTLLEYCVQGFYCHLTMYTNL